MSPFLLELAMGLRPFVVISCALILSACTQNPQWTLFYSDSQSHIAEQDLGDNIAGYYKALDQCVAKGKGLIRLSGHSNGSFQCGHQCVANEQGGVSCQRLTQEAEL
ncbi:hypothetical protein [Shewanella waksmanii]|uniref:hypothetical protein n=1 Tax=Shewanella waksmanii TaxID=213783 RepID=UPI001FDF1CF6|nr:hypothetical protein [Shewanella waksmanii]